MSVKNMSHEQAAKLLGINVKRDHVSNMRTALSIGRYNNTEEEAERLIAADFVLRDWTNFSRHCDDRRRRIRQGVG